MKNTTVMVSPVRMTSRTIHATIRALPGKRVRMIAAFIATLPPKDRRNERRMTYLVTHAYQFGDSVHITAQSQRGRVVTMSINDVEAAQS